MFRRLVSVSIWFVSMTLVSASTGFAQETESAFKYFKIAFHQTYLKPVTEEARSEHDGYFIMYIYKPDLPAHQMMDSLYFADPKFSSYIKENYAALSVDYNIPQGFGFMDLALRGHGDSINLGAFVPGEHSRDPLIWDAELDVIAAHLYIQNHELIDAERSGARIRRRGIVMALYVPDKTLRSSIIPSQGHSEIFSLKVSGFLSVSADGLWNSPIRR